MKKIRKSTGVALAFLIYVSVTAAYLLPRNTEVSLTEKIITVAVSYVIVLLPVSYTHLTLPTKA